MARLIYLSQGFPRHFAYILLCSKVCNHVLDVVLLVHCLYWGPYVRVVYCELNIWAPLNKVIIITIIIIIIIVVSVKLDPLEANKIHVHYYEKQI